MTDLEYLQARKTAILLELSTLTGEKPSYSIDGQSVSWTEYRRMLFEQLKTINDLINMEDPFEFQTIAV